MTPKKVPSKLTLTFRQLQTEHKTWSSRNFDTQFPDTVKFWQPIFGVMEELGELTHALLKQSQNIRGTDAEHIQKQKDAIGDITIFLASTCSALGFNFQELVETTWNEVKQRNYKKDKGLVNG
jgi:NTP pyrophosphatase (non-canonical NTP hydrolase)